MAEVTACHYDVRAGRALAFGLTSSKHFRITYNYRVGNELHTREYFSETARSPGSLFPICCYRDLPRVSRPGDHATSTFASVAIGVTGSIVLSLVWLLVLRGC